MLLTPKDYNYFNKLFVFMVLGDFTIFNTKFNLN